MVFISYLHNAIRLSTLFLFGATGETITEKSGHLNLGTPGIMCMGAIGSCIGEMIYFSNIAIVDGATPDANWFLVIFFGIAFAMLFAGIGGLIYAFLTISLRCNQNVSGLAITTFGVGLTNFIRPLLDSSKFTYASTYFTAYIPGIDKAGWFSDLFLTYGCIVYFAIFVAVLTTFIFKKTRVGLNLRAIGENPAAADAVGIRVNKYKYISCVLGAAIAGLGGMFYIFDYLGGNWEYTIEAMGWLAVALVIFSIWNPSISIAGSILFGALYIAPVYISTTFAVKELVKMLPYLMTVIVLIITSAMNKKETQPPSALGIPYFREDR